MNVHPVRACSQPFVCGGDDYLFILFDGSFQVRAVVSPVASLAGAAAAPLRSPPSAHCAVALVLLTSRVPSVLTGRGIRLAARGFQQLGWRVKSGKFESGLLPHFHFNCARSLLWHGDER